MPAPAALLATALAHARAGRLAEAAQACEQILAIDPRQLDALHTLGQLALRRGEAARAESLFARALAVHPAASLHVQHGLALRALARPADALAAFQRALRIEPALAEAHHQAGNALKTLGRFADAAAALREAARLAPDRAAIQLNLGVALLETNSREEAIAAFQRAVALEPARPETHNILGHALASAGHHTAARAAFAEALRLRPGYAAAHDNLGRLCKAEGLLPEAVAHFRAALAAQPAPGTHSNLLLALNYLPDLEPGAVFAEHRRWQELYARPLATAATAGGATTVSRVAPISPAVAPALATTHLHGSASASDLSIQPAADRRLRIGYLSPDFTHHAVAYFIEPVLAAHDRARVEVFCYANVRAPDRFTARLRGHAEHWRDIALLHDAAATDLIRRDRLDLLIDLAGHTAHHRLLVLARRPAPVQATWIGYPNTTGLDAIDYRITDAISDPPGETERYHAEKLFRLPATFSCYRPDDDAPPVNPLPASTPGAVTFGCFNNFAKLTPEVLALWAQLLRELPASRLLLKSRGLGDPGVATRIRGVFAAAGIAPERIALNGEELSVAAHLSLYHGVDIALDPFPYNGTTTTCEALWMGVPVVTLAGRVHAARVGASLLTHTRLTEWIASSPARYLEIAHTAGHELPRLAALRAGLRERLRTSPLCDAEKFTRDLEAAYATMCA